MNNLTTTYDLLDELIALKADIKNAISEHGVDMTDAKYTEYSDKIREIKTSDRPKLSNTLISDLTYFKWTEDDITKLSEKVWWTETTASNYEIPSVDKIELAGYDVNTTEDYEIEDISVLKSRTLSFIAPRFLPKFTVSNNVLDNLFENFTYAEAIPDFSVIASSLNSTFKNCLNLKYLPVFNTSSAVSAMNTFENCCSLNTVEIDLTSCENIKSSFSNCYNLRSLNIITGAALVNVENAFMNCYNLVSIDSLDFTNIDSTQNCFKNCYMLSTLKINNLKTDIDLSQSPNISKESILYIIESANPTASFNISLNEKTYFSYFDEYDGDTDCKNAINSANGRITVS